MKHLITRSPFLVNSFFEDFDKFFDTFFSDITRNDVIRNMEGYPVANIFTNVNGDVKFEIAITGFNENELKVLVEDGCLIVKGEKEEKKNEEDDWKIIAGKLKKSSFEKRYKLSNRLDAEKTEVDITDNGLLIIRVPAKEEVKPKQISITKFKQIK